MESKSKEEKNKGRRGRCRATSPPHLLCGRMRSFCPRRNAVLRRRLRCFAQKPSAQIGEDAGSDAPAGARRSRGPAVPGVLRVLPEERRPRDCREKC